jgi:hypothetical protein
LIRLACIVLIAALVMVGYALAENAVDEAKVDKETMDIITTIQGTLFNSEQSVSGVGLANVNSNLATIDSGGSKSLALKSLGSGTGSYSHNSTVYVQDNVVATRSGDYSSSNRKITAKDDVSAVYAPINYQFPGTFRAKTIGSLWKDDTCSKNFAGSISMDARFDYARTLNKETTTTLYSSQKSYGDYLTSSSSSIGSTMDLTSNADGRTHIGATLNDVRGENQIMKHKSGSLLVDEDYFGSFTTTKKMAVSILTKTIAPDYDWLPCTCNEGWNDMTIHDQRYHSAKGFFDCTSCQFPYCTP